MNEYISSLPKVVLQVLGFTTIIAISQLIPLWSSTWIFDLVCVVAIYMLYLYGKDDPSIPLLPELTPVMIARHITMIVSIVVVCMTYSLTVPVIHLVLLYAIMYYISINQRKVKKSDNDTNLS